VVQQKIQSTLSYNGITFRSYTILPKSYSNIDFWLELCSNAWEMAGNLVDDVKYIEY